MDFGISNTKRGNYAVVAVRGELDVVTAPPFEEAIDELLRAGEDHIVIDLHEVDFLDSSSLRVLVGASRQLSEPGRDLSLVCNEPRILKIFQITNLDTVFTIHDSLEAAISE